ncbi:FAD/NAD(P)-binding domain-containing protein [Apiospora sp. TS-2023a]
MSSTQKQPSKFRLAIGGGGISGLALAAALTKSSCREQLAITVYESVPEYKDVGAGLALHLNAIKAMALLGPELQRTYFESALTMAAEEDTEMSTTVMLAQGPHAGTVVAELGKAKGRKSIARSDLVQGFLELVPEGTVKFGKRLVKIEETERVVKLSFKDGTTAEADALIGADGIHSITRSYLLGADHPATEPKNHDGWIVYRTLVSTEEARQKINPRWTTNVPIMMGPRGHINCIPLSKNTRLSAGVAVRGNVLRALTSSAAPDDDNDPQSKPKLDPSLYADYTEEAQQIVRLVAADTSASWTAADHDHAPTYHRGRVCLLGDAAHASLPFAGNGAAQALEDAAVLHALFDSSASSSTFSPTDLHDEEKGVIGKMFEAYDAVRRPRSQAVVDLARRFGRVYAYAEDGMHEDPVRMKAFFAEMSAFTNQFDVRGQNEEAVRVFEGLMMGRVGGDGDDGKGRGELPN